MRTSGARHLATDRLTRGYALSVTGRTARWIVMRHHPQHRNILICRPLYVPGFAAEGCRKLSGYGGGVAQMEPDSIWYVPSVSRMGMEFGPPSTDPCAQTGIGYGAFSSGSLLSTCA